MQNNQKNNTTHEIINVNNITFSYNQKEDRMLFILNHSNLNQRIDFFVTRRMLIQLLESFDMILINHCDNGKVFKQLYFEQEVLEKSEIIMKNKLKNQKSEDKSKTWEKSINTKELDFTKINEPLLLDSLSYSILKNNITFKYISNNKILAISKMDTIMFQRTLSSMMRVIPFIAWGISPHILD